MVRLVSREFEQKKIREVKEVGFETHKCQNVKYPAMLSRVFSADTVSKTRKLSRADGSKHYEKGQDAEKCHRDCTSSSRCTIHLRSPESVTCTPSFFAFSASQALPSGVVAEHIVAARPSTRAVKTFIVELLLWSLFLLSQSPHSEDSFSTGYCWYITLLGSCGYRIFLSFFFFSEERAAAHTMSYFNL